jgi:hypothetical protein
VSSRDSIWGAIVGSCDSVRSAIPQILNNLSILYVDGRIILRWIFRKWEGVVGTGWSGLRIGTGGGNL